MRINSGPLAGSHIAFSLIAGDTYIELVSQGARYRWKVNPDLTLDDGTIQNEPVRFDDIHTAPGHVPTSTGWVARPITSLTAEPIRVRYRFDSPEAAAILSSLKSDSVKVDPSCT